MIVTKNVNIDLLFEELQAIPNSFRIDELGKKHLLFGILKIEGGYDIRGLDEKIVSQIVDAHDATKKSDAELEKEKKEFDKNKVLQKLKITEEELRTLLE